jgi:hypothetical protein
MKDGINLKKHREDEWKRDKAKNTQPGSVGGQRSISLSLFVFVSPFSLSMS